MATAPPPTARQKWAFAQKIEAELKALMAEQRPTFEDFERLIKELRMACEATIFADIEYACTVRVGHRLWDAHITINKRYRKLLDRFKQAEQKKHVVERRKLEKHYADFIKTSQFFYKGYIQRLASHFDGLAGLRRIANRLSLSTLSADARVQVSPKVEHLIEMSCHATLLRLGDLSRYRNELRTKDRSWDAAMGYYSLANDLHPDAGSAHNQMSVIALKDDNHLNAVYHMYRSLTTREPHELASGNLELEFKKIKSSWDKKRSQPKTDSLSTLIWWFILLHAKFYDGVVFSTHDELENEVLSRLTLLLKEQSFGDTLEKFVIINVAAEYFAAQRLKANAQNITPDLFQAYYFTMAFNIRTMFVLLQVLLPELEDGASGEEIPNGSDGSQPQKPREKISAIARRIIPALRQYSLWLTSKAELINSIDGCRPITIHAKELWMMYALVLTRLTNFFPVLELPTVSYLLEEDESTVGFMPFRELELPVNITYDLYIDDSTHTLKPRITDTGVERHHPNIEMQARVRDVILCGLGMQMRKGVPINLNTSGPDGPIFEFLESELTTSSPVRPQPKRAPVVSPTPSITSRVRAPRNRNFELLSTEPLMTGAESVAASDSHQSMDTDMHRMVDSLLEPSSTNPNSSVNETSYGMHSYTANEIFAPHSLNGCYDNRIQGTPKILPSLPGFYNSAFAPLPNELQPTSPTRLANSNQLSPLSLATNEQRIAAATALDRATGYGRTSASWGRRHSRPLSNSDTTGVNDQLQASLAARFNPSSAFSDSSSIYANSPLLGKSRTSAPTRTSILSNGNNTTFYPGATDFDKTTMLQSSLWNDDKPQTYDEYIQTPPAGQKR